jgi:hypothetical protein
MHYRSVVDFFDDRGQGSYQLNLLLKRSQNNLFQNIQPDTMLGALGLGFIAIGSALVINEIFGSSVECVGGRFAENQP